ncbi:FAD-dependent oxidoreductase, partial [Microbacterium sp. UBA837]
MPVVIIGAGPVGMLLGGELARLGVEHITLEAREAPGAGSRAIGIHSAALTAMSASGVTDRILSACLQVREGQARVGAATVTTIRFDAVRAGSLASFPFVATLPQAATESAITAAAASNGAPAPERGVQVLDVIDEGATCRVITDSGDVHGDAVVIAAGSRSRHISSLIRDGRRRAYPDRYVMADVPDDTDEGPRAIVHLHPDGVLESFPLPGGLRRYVAWHRAGST